MVQIKDLLDTRLKRTESGELPAPKITASNVAFAGLCLGITCLVAVSVTRYISDLTDKLFE